MVEVTKKVLEDLKKWTKVQYKRASDRYYKNKTDRNIMLKDECKWAYQVMVLLCKGKEKELYERQGWSHELKMLNKIKECPEEHYDFKCFGTEIKIVRVKEIRQNRKIIRRETPFYTVKVITRNEYKMKCINYYGEFKELETAKLYFLEEIKNFCNEQNGYLF